MKNFIQLTTFTLVYPLWYLLSLLPFAVLYRVSDLFYLVFYRMIGYRRGVVRENLKRSFPEKNEAERLKIEQKFYRFFSDVMVETMKAVSMPLSEIRKRCQVDDSLKTLFREMEKRQQAFILVLGHRGNWEWANISVGAELEIPFHGVYKPLTQPYFNRLMFYIRSKGGTHLVSMYGAMKRLEKAVESPGSVALVADQTPHPESACWMEFMNQDTPVFWGTERLAKEKNLPIVYLQIMHPKRGYYVMSGELLVNDPQKYPTGEITIMHTQRLEKDIYRQPVIWLWSHRRWKYNRPEEPAVGIK